MFNDILPNILDILKIALTFILKGGWVIFSVAFIYVLYRLYIVEIQHQFVDSQQWVFLKIRVPKSNLTSTLAVEQVFALMHSLHRSYTFMQTYVEGSVQLWYSLEIVSMGGKISYILRVPKAYRGIVESSFYAHYPEAEITETSDYMENVTYDPDISDFEVLGTEFKMADDDVIPIKTYSDFEHTSATEKIIDPLSNLLESLAKLDSYDFVGVQILIQPLGDEEWKPRGERKIKALIGEEVPHEPSFIGFLMAPFNWFANFSYKKTLLTSHDHDEKEKTQKNNWMSMTEAEKDRVSRIEAKIGKPGYKTKMRFLYMTPKGKVEKTKRYLIVGAFRPFGSAMTNRIKVQSDTWVGVDPIFSEALEKSYLDAWLKKLKRRHFKGYKARSLHLGASPFILNIEELATLYHFPITTETTSVPASVEATESKKSQPPVNLPVVEELS